MTALFSQKLWGQDWARLPGIMERRLAAEALQRRFLLLCHLANVDLDQMTCVDVPADITTREQAPTVIDEILNQLGPQPALAGSSGHNVVDRDMIRMAIVAEWDEEKAGLNLCHNLAHGLI